MRASGPATAVWTSGGMYAGLPHLPRHCGSGMESLDGRPPSGVRRSTASPKSVRTILKPWRPASWASGRWGLGISDEAGLRKDSPWRKDGWFGVRGRGASSAVRRRLLSSTNSQLSSLMSRCTTPVSSRNSRTWNMSTATRQSSLQVTKPLRWPRPAAALALAKALREPPDASGRTISNVRVFAMSDASNPRSTSSMKWCSTGSRHRCLSFVCRDTSILHWSSKKASTLPAGD
mmetsp:Transcript_29056/g.84852  ORF Transcript_29056/g.84852 Transcript_29056/m.84852 type:complete len:233 (-) Transcript_29056:197-895(-)